MHVLAIDTATDTVVTGIADITTESDAVSVRAERSVSDHRRHAEVLTTLIAECLGESGISRDELSAVVVGCGPGPFTGLRVGMATGAAFSDGLGLPAYPVCSLDAVAAQENADHPDAGSVLVVTDARRREIYWARYEHGVRVDGPAVEAPSVVVDVLAGQRIDVVAGSPSHAALFGRVTGHTTVPTVAGLVAVSRADVLAARSPEPLIPLYLRRPDAVERKDQQRKAVGAS